MPGSGISLLSTFRQGRLGAGSGQSGPTLSGVDDAARDDGASGPGFFSGHGVGYTYRWFELPGHWARLLRVVTIDAMRAARQRRAAAAEYTKRREAGQPPA
jgi:hypothetical protein